MQKRKGPKKQAKLKTDYSFPASPETHQSRWRAGDRGCRCPRFGRSPVSEDTSGSPVPLVPSSLTAPADATPMAATMASASALPQRVAQSHVSDRRLVQTTGLDQQYARRQYGCGRRRRASERRADVGDRSASGRSGRQRPAWPGNAVIDTATPADAGGDRRRARPIVPRDLPDGAADQRAHRALCGAAGCAIGDDTVLVARVDGSPAGFAYIGPSDDDDAPPQDRPRPLAARRSHASLGRHRAPPARRGAAPLRRGR